MEMTNDGGWGPRCVVWAPGMNWFRTFLSSSTTTSAIAPICDRKYMYGHYHNSTTPHYHCAILQTLHPPSPLQTRIWIHQTLIRTLLPLRMHLIHHLTILLLTVGNVQPRVLVIGLGLLLQEQVEEEERILDQSRDLHVGEWTEIGLHRLLVMDEICLRHCTASWSWTRSVFTTAFWSWTRSVSTTAFWSWTR